MYVTRSSGFSRAPSRRGSSRSVEGGEEQAERPVDPVPILRPDEVEEQAPEDREAQARAGSRLVAGPERGDRREPVVDQPRQEPCEGLLAASRAGVALEEQSLGRPERRVAEPAPHRLNGRRARLGRKGGEEVALVRLDALDDGRQQPLARAEVMEEHPVAGPDLACEVPKRAVADPAPPHLLDDCVQDVLPSHASECTIWYTYQMVHTLSTWSHSP